MMKTWCAVALPLLCGIVIGAIGSDGLRAQAKPPVYLIANNEVSDPDGYMKEYAPLARATLKAHGAVNIAAGKGTVIDGEPPKGRLVIVRWDSMEQLLAWYHSPEYEAAHKIGEKYAKFNIVAVEGAQP
jgi:uncharacterized protein (DUF1330 family)